MNRNRNNVVRLSESRLRDLIKEAVRKAVNEGTSETYDNYKKEYLEASRLLYKAEKIINDLERKSNTIGGDGDPTMKSASSKYEDGLRKSRAYLNDAIRYFEGYFRGDMYDAERFNDSMNY